MTARSIVPRLKWRPGGVNFAAACQALSAGYVVGAHDLFHFTSLHLSIAAGAVSDFVVAFTAIICGQTRPVLSNPSQATVIGGRRCMMAPVGTLAGRWRGIPSLRALHIVCALASFTE
jgi:hypothetical protein